MKVLFIEDNEHKIKQVLLFFELNFPDVEVVLRKSYNSGLRELIKKNDFDLIEFWNQVFARISAISYKKESKGTASDQFNLTAINAGDTLTPNLGPTFERASPWLVHIPSRFKFQIGAALGILHPVNHGFQGQLHPVPAAH